MQRCLQLQLIDLSLPLSSQLACESASVEIHTTTDLCRHTCVNTLSKVALFKALGPAELSFSLRERINRTCSTFPFPKSNETNFD